LLLPLSLTSYPLPRRQFSTLDHTLGRTLGRWLCAWHFLSLDAPTVAALWAWFLARSLGLEPPAWAVPLLALATWLLYVGDRILDGLGTDAAGRAAWRERHLFHRRHRVALAATGATGAVVLVAAALARLPAVELRGDLLVAAATLLYLLIVHGVHGIHGIQGVHGRRGAAERWLPKEMAVASIFALATAVPAWTLAGSQRPALMIEVALFAAVCWLNCVAIGKWEDHAAIHATTRWAGAHLPGIALLVAAAAAVALPLRAAAAVLVTALVIWGLDAGRDRFTALQLRIAADAALLTPLLWLRR